MDGVDVEDIDGDGDLDFMACDGIQEHVFLYTNDGTGYFVPSLAVSDVSSNWWSTNLRIIDFNDDGLLDFV